MSGVFIKCYNENENECEQTQQELTIMRMNSMFCVFYFPLSVMVLLFLHSTFNAFHMTASDAFELPNISHHILMKLTDWKIDRWENEADLCVSSTKLPLN